MCCCCARSRARCSNKSDHTVPEEFFLDMLDEQFSEEETLRQLETAINWGRYAELFDFDAARRRFILPETRSRRRKPYEGARSGVKSRYTFSRTLVVESDLAVLSRPDGRGGAAGGLLCHPVDREVLVQRCDSRSRDLPLALASAALCVLFHGAHLRGVSAEPDLCRRLRLRRRVQPACGSADDCDAGHSAVDSGAELSAGRDAGDDVAVSVAGSLASSWARSC